MKLVHLVGFIIKKFFTMHGHINLKFNNSVYVLEVDTRLQTSNVYMKLFLGALVKSRKATISFVIAVCPSFWPHGTNWSLQWTQFVTFEYF